MADIPFVSGAKTALSLIDKRPNQRVTVFGPKFKQELKQEGITFGQKPQEFLGAYAARLLTDVVTDGTRACPLYTSYTSDAFPPSPTTVDGLSMIQIYHLIALCHI